MKQTPLFGVCQQIILATFLQLTITTMVRQKPPIISMLLITVLSDCLHQLVIEPHSQEPLARMVILDILQAIIILHVLLVTGR